MTTTNTTTAVQRELIYEVTAWDFLQRVQDLVIQGYRLDESNENFPIVSVGSYTCGMVKVEQQKQVPQTEEVPAQQPSTVQDVKPATQKRGNRK